MGAQPWYCVGCGEILGTTLANELTLDSGRISTRGANVLVTCQKCGALKTWYPNDQVVRATYQLIDAFVNVAVAKMVRK